MTARDTPAWPIVYTGGDARTRGRQYGEQARERIHGSIGIYSEVFHHYARLSWNDVCERAGAFADAIARYDEQLLPEMEGIAAGAGWVSPTSSRSTSAPR